MRNPDPDESRNEKQSMNGEGVSTTTIFNNLDKRPSNNNVRKDSLDEMNDDSKAEQSVRIGRQLLKVSVILIID